MSGVEPVAKRRSPEKLTLTVRRTPNDGEGGKAKRRQSTFRVPQIKLMGRASAVALVAGLFAFGQPSSTGHLDAAHLLGLGGSGTDRWQTFLMASPAGSIHQATVHRSEPSLGALSHAGLGQLDGNGLQRTAMAPSQTIAPALAADDIITGSISADRLPTGPDPLVARSSRQHLSMTPAVHALVQSRRVSVPLIERHPFEQLELASLPTTGGFDGHVGLIPPPPPIIVAAQEPEQPVGPVAGSEPGSYALALVDPSSGGSPLQQTEGQQQISAFLTNDRQFQCLAEGVYFEARGETRRGQVAVAQVIMNRVNHDEFPDTICGVVYQNQHWRNRCQFSFACDGVPERITEPRAWELAEEVSRQVLEGRDLIDTITDSTHYHATYVRPRWAPRMIRLDRVGLHIFYKGRYGGWR